MKKEDKAKLEQLESRIHRLEVIAEMLVRKVYLIQMKLKVRLTILMK